MGIPYRRIFISLVTWIFLFKLLLFLGKLTGVPEQETSIKLSLWAIFLSNAFLISNSLGFTLLFYCSVRFFTEIFTLERLL